jgi:hypothetical protein
MARKQSAQTWVVLRGADYLAMAEDVYPGSKPYRSDGAMYPGDDPEITDVTLMPEPGAPALDWDDLTLGEQAEVEDALLDAADRDALESYVDAMEARADAARDERRFAQGDR